MSQHTAPLGVPSRTPAITPLPPVALLRGASLFSTARILAAMTLTLSLPDPASPSRRSPPPPPVPTFPATPSTGGGPLCPPSLFRAGTRTRVRGTSDRKCRRTVASRDRYVTLCRKTAFPQRTLCALCTSPMYAASVDASIFSTEIILPALEKIRNGY